MNFITRNLGWLLLLLFFLFMLFVISSNGKTEETSQKMASGELMKETESGSEDLDELVKMMDKQEEENIKEILDMKESTKESIKDNIDEESKQSFFSRIFGKNKKQEQETDKKKYNDSSMQEESEENLEERQVKQMRNITENGNSRESGNLTKVSTSKTASQAAYASIEEYAPEMLEEMYPGLSLKTAIGKQFEIGVHSLKLNNAYFNKTLGYMLKGEKVTQLTKENSYGCFQIEVESSKQSGYVCKKYLRELNQENTVIAPEKIVKSSTQIGDLITIKTSELILNNTNVVLAIGDVVDQMTPTNANGCFMVHVLSSSVPYSQGRVGNICYSDLK